MKKIQLVILSSFIFLSANASFAQQCNCSAAFNWAKKEFEENDAGYQYIIDQKGREAYQLHNGIFQKRVKKITNADSCVLAIKDWSRFFRVGHFRFVVNQAPAQQGNATSRIARDSIYVRDYDANTTYLRITTFDSNHTKQIDSVLSANKQKITSKKNLIIDIRDNGGGTDQSFFNIIPILYTNPIRNLPVEYLSTPQNNQSWEERMQQKDLNEASRAWYAGSVKKLHANPGKFVMLSSDSVYFTTYDVKYPQPANVAVIINGNNGSTAEQFLLAARQSKKVKLFGTTTMGELDISNMYSVTSPDKQYTLWYCTSKSLRIPDFTIDNKGISPDFYIDRSVPKDKWVPYVAGIMKDWQ